MYGNGGGFKLDEYGSVDALLWSDWVMFVYLTYNHDNSGSASCKTPITNWIGEKRVRVHLSSQKGAR